MTRHIVVIGKTGQLARALSAQAGQLGYEVTSYGRDACDLSASEDEIRAFAKTLPQCEAIIIAAAYTAVDAAEDDIEAAFQVNGVAPGVFAELCHARSIPIIHVSTDYVFAGNAKAPIKPDEPTDPINAYGRSKLAGEQAVLDSGARAAILRTSWVFDGTGKNFLTTMLRLAQTRDQLSVVADQIGRPTYAGHLASACFAAATGLIENLNQPASVYHVSNKGDAISWADFSRAIFKAAKNHIANDMKVVDIPAAEYPTPAKRPSYSVMDVSKFESEFNYKLPTWQMGLKQAILCATELNFMI